MAEHISHFVVQIKSLVSDSGGVKEAAARFSLRPSTLEKVLSGRRLSPPAYKKLVKLLQNPDSVGPGARITESEEQRLETAYRHYQDLGTLEAVGRRMGLTRERIRQLLVKGTGLGLFKYQGREYPYVAKDKILADYRKACSLQRTAALNSVSEPYLRKLLTVYSVTTRDLRRLASDGRKDKCVFHYRRLMARVGHHPSTTELQATSEGHSLHMRINRLWGSIEAFRESLAIPEFAKGNPHFVQHTAAWRNHQRRLAVVLRMQQLDEIREYLDRHGPLSGSGVARACGLNLNRVRRLLNLLEAGREVRRVGKGNLTKYALRAGGTKG